MVRTCREIYRGGKGHAPPQPPLVQVVNESNNNQENYDTLIVEITTTVH